MLIYSAKTRGFRLVDSVTVRIIVQIWNQAAKYVDLLFSASLSAVTSCGRPQAQSLYWHLAPIHAD